MEVNVVSPKCDENTTVCVCDFTVFEDAQQQGLVGLAVPPVGRDLGVEGLGDPDVQLAAAGRDQITLLIIQANRLCAFNSLQSANSLVFQ